MPCKDTGRRCLSTSQKENPHQDVNVLAPWPGIPSLENREKDSCCLSHPVYGRVLQRPELNDGHRGQADTPPDHSLPATEKCFVYDEFYLLSMFKCLLLFPHLLFGKSTPPSNQFAPFKYLINSILSQSLMLARKVTLSLHPL